MTSTTHSHSGHDDEGVTEALAKASEALDELRGLAGEIEADGLTGEHAVKEPDAAQDHDDLLSEEMSERMEDEYLDIPLPPLVTAQPVVPPVADVQESAAEKNPEKILLSELLQQKSETPVTPPAAKQRVGEILRDARIAVNLALEDIAAEIKIKPHHLLAIEESRFNDLPSRTYAVGFVRAYANTLSLDAETLVAECRREISRLMPQKQPQMMMPEAVASERPMPSASLVILTAAAAFLLTAIGYVFTRDTVETTATINPPAVTQSKAAPAQAEQKAAAPVVVAPPPQVAAQTVPQVVAPPVQTVQPPVQQAGVPHEEPAAVDTADVDTTHVSSGFLQKGLVAPSIQMNGPVAGKIAAPSRIKLKAVEETTVQIFDASGRMVAERVINKGEAFYVPDKAGLTLATTNAGALHMQIDGREMQPLGETDEAMHNIPLNPDSLLKYLQ